MLRTYHRQQRVRLSASLTLIGAGLALAMAVPAAAATPAACPPQPMRVVRSTGGNLDYAGAVPGIPDLCHLARTGGSGDYYFGVWKTDWPGAGDAYPALVAAVRGPEGTRATFITHSVPGWQWTDTLTNEGIVPLVIAGTTYQTLKLAHERKGFDGNYYHSIITSWRDVGTGINLKVVEDQIAGQSYGPSTTWQATDVQLLPKAADAAD